MREKYDINKIEICEFDCIYFRYRTDTDFRNGKVILWLLYSLNNSIIALTISNFQTGKLSAVRELLDRIQMDYKEFHPLYFGSFIKRNALKLRCIYYPILRSKVRVLWGYLCPVKILLAHIKLQFRCFIPWYSLSTLHQFKINPIEFRTVSNQWLFTFYCCKRTRWKTQRCHSEIHSCDFSIPSPTCTSLRDW